MFLEGRGKQSQHKENSEDALTNEGSHNALAQLSVSGRPCKAKARWGSTGILPVGRSGVSPEHVVANFRQAGSPPAPQAGCLCYLRRIIRFRLRARLTL